MYESIIEQIITSILKFYNIDKKSLFSLSRRADIAEARQVLAYCLRKKIKLSFPVIGKFLGRDHTTIIHACGKIEELITSGGYMADLIDFILDNSSINEDLEIIKKKESSKSKRRSNHIENIVIGKNLPPNKDLMQEYGKSHNVMLFLPKFKIDVPDVVLPIEFSKNYVLESLSKLKDRENLLIYKRYGFDGSDMMTLSKIAESESITRERVRQVIANGISHLYFNNYGGVRQIIMLILERILKNNIVYLDSIVNEIFILDETEKALSKKFILVIFSFLVWIKNFELSGQSFLICSYNESVVLDYIDNIKILIRKIVRNKGDEINNWEGIKNELIQSNYFFDKKFLLDKAFLRACYDNYLLESVIVIHKQERKEKYSKKNKKANLKIDGVPDEYNIFFQ